MIVPLVKGYNQSSQQEDYCNPHHLQIQLKFQLGIFCYKRPA